MIQKIKVSEIRPNPNNPRVIKDDKFKKLLKSITDFPQMLELRPIVVNDDMIVLGGNMRLKALEHLGIEETYIIKAKDLTDKQEQEFIIKDNVGYGEWDWDVLANEYDTDELNNWGLDLWKAPVEVDYSILDDDGDMEQLLEDLASGVKKAIQIEFEAEHYEEAQELVKFWRDKKLYIGGFIMEKLKEEKDKL
jgi:hypothetical protein